MLDVSWKLWLRWIMRLYCPSLKIQRKTISFYVCDHFIWLDWTLLRSSYFLFEDSTSVWQMISLGETDVCQIFEEKTWQKFWAKKVCFFLLIFDGLTSYPSSDFANKKSIYVRLLTPSTYRWDQFHQRSTYRFNTCRAQKRKMILTT